MTATLKLVHGATELDFLTAAGEGLKLQKWYPSETKVAYGYMPPYVVEEMDVRADGSSHDGLAAIIQALDQMRWWAAMYDRDKLVYEPVWLHAKMDGETEERRSHVQDISIEWRSNQISATGVAAAYKAILRLTIKRHSYWEQVGDPGLGKQVSSAGASILYDYTDAAGGDVVGDVPARWMLSVSQSATSGANVDRLWCGLRSTKFGDPSKFANIWEIEDATTFFYGTKTTDATASPGGAGNTKLLVDTFGATPGWAKRVTLVLDDVTSDYEDQAGRFLWLMRCKVDSGTVCEARLHWGNEYDADAEYTQGDAVQISNTDWDYMVMGESQIPPADLRAQIYTTGAPFNLQAHAIQIWARRTAGSGDLHLDCLCPIPLDEGWLIAEDLRITAVLHTFYAMPTPNDEPNFWWIYAGGVDSLRSVIPVAAHNFYLPPGDGRLIIVHADESSHDISEQIRITSFWYPRWVNLRGTEEAPAA